MTRYWRDNQARILKALHGWFVVFWVVMIPVTFATHLVDRVWFVSVISLWSLVSTEWGAWQGSRAEVRVEDADISAEHADVSADEVHVQ